MPSCNQCKVEFPNWVDIEGKKRNLSNRKYCLVCSPFGQHNTRPLGLVAETKVCPQCKIEKGIDLFYKRRGSKPSPYCKECSDQKTHSRARNLKLTCISYKGGTCVKCGYATSSRALDFHHIDETKKDFTISANRNVAFETLKSELDKCLLLCSNCHKQLHVDQRHAKLLLLSMTPNIDGKKCGGCRQHLSSESFYQKKSGNLSWLCIKCTSIDQFTRRNAAKIKAINYKGGCCSVCGYTGYPEVFEFHHTDPR